MFEDIKYKDGKLFRSGKEVGTFNDNGYLVFNYLYRLYYVHRVVWYLHHGEWPKGVIDHRDEDRSNNRIENLRDTSYSGNFHNKSAPNKDNKTSGVRGVHKHTTSGKWIAQITIKGKKKHLGSFETIAEASAAYQKAKQKVKE